MQKVTGVLSETDFCQIRIFDIRTAVRFGQQFIWRTLVRIQLHECLRTHNEVHTTYIDITAVLRAVFYIARVLACNILYLPEGPQHGGPPGPEGRVLYDFTARMHEDDIVYIHQRAQRAGIALKTKYSPLVDI